jgi:DNA invertase Pin-like site-specific DNA recombinase
MQDNRELERTNGTPQSLTAVVGYSTYSGTGQAGAEQLKQEAMVIARECEDRGLHLTEVVGDPESATQRGLSRPGLAYVLDRIGTGDAEGLVVSDLSKFSESSAELGTIIEWLSRADARFVAAAQSLDTSCAHGRLFADLLIEVSRRERARFSERTRNGLAAARTNGKTTGRRAVTDNPDLTQRISQMRAEGMTLQAIADRLNEEGVPTVRGGAKWRHSSVQAAAGYRRRRESPESARLRQPPARKPRSNGSRDMK